MTAVAPTYAALVNSDADMIGHVAYSLYKREKLKFCEDTAAANGVPVTAAELTVFARAANMPQRVLAYRTQAAAALGDFADEVMAEQLEQETKRIEAEYIVDLRKGRSWARGVGENLVANVLAFAIVALVAAILYGARIGFVPLLADMFNYEVKEKAPAAPAPASVPTR